MFIKAADGARVKTIALRRAIKASLTGEVCMTPDNLLDAIRKANVPYASFLGLEITEASADRVCGTLLVRPELCTMPATLHGGAIMSMADNLGALGAFLNLPEGAMTTTLESKTNFLAAIPQGETAHAEATPVHRGRRTQVWKTEIRRADGRLAAVVTQTQMTLEPKAAG